MSDHDRLISYAERVLEDSCLGCRFSKVYCDCVKYIDSKSCCPNCSHVNESAPTPL